MITPAWFRYLWHPCSCTPWTYHPHHDTIVVLAVWCTPCAMYGRPYTSWTLHIVGLAHFGLEPCTHRYIHPLHKLDLAHIVPCTPSTVHTFVDIAHFTHLGLYTPSTNIGSWTPCALHIFNHSTWDLGHTFGLTFTYLWPHTPCIHWTLYTLDQSPHTSWYCCWYSCLVHTLCHTHLWTYTSWTL